MTNQVSLITCTHNPNKSYYDLVLSAINKISGRTDNFEYIIIDNNSQPALSLYEIESRITNKISIKLIQELEPGLTNARRRGILAAQFELILFIDDDVVIEADYIIHCLDLFNRYTHSGAWNAGNIKVKYLDTELNKWYYSKGLGYFQESDVFGTIYHNDPLGFFPFGTGLVIRKDICIEYIKYLENKHFTLTDRYKSIMSSSGDNQLVLTGILLGYSVGRSDLLKLVHIVSPQKSTLTYLLKLVHGQTYSTKLFLAENIFYKGIPESAYYYIKNFIFYILFLFMNLDFRTFALRVSGMKGVYRANKLLKSKRFS